MANSVRFDRSINLGQILAVMVFAFTLFATAWTFRVGLEARLVRIEVRQEIAERLIRDIQEQVRR